MHAMDPLMTSIEAACGMENVFEELHMPPETWYTYAQSLNMTSGRSRIDHVLASAGMSTQGMITRAGIYTAPLMRSKHRAAVIELDIGRILHIKDPTLPTPIPPPQRILQFSDKDACTKFEKALDHLAAEEDLRGSYDLCLGMVTDDPQNSSLYAKLDQLMDHAADMVLRAAQTLSKYKFAPDTKHKNGMSPEMVRRTAATRRLQHLTRMWYSIACAPDALPAVYTTALQTIRNAYYLTDRYVGGDKLTVKDELQRLGLTDPPDNDDRPEWAYWIHCLASTIAGALKALHGRYRLRMR